MPRPLPPTIAKLYLFAASQNALVVIPVIVVFFRANGLNLTQVFILQGVFAVVLAVLEVPSGYIADV
jgi:hypothetical protein